jgi:hypothetical protein
MSDLIPYFAGFITLLFSFAFLLALRGDKSEKTV